MGCRRCYGDRYSTQSEGVGLTAPEVAGGDSAVLSSVFVCDRMLIHNPQRNSKNVQVPGNYKISAECHDHTKLHCGR